MIPEDKYISVNEFKKILAGLVVEGGSDAVRSAIVKTLSEVVPQFLDNAPSADVQPVKHGEWKINSDGYYPYCSACGTAADQLVKRLTKYCPECGARMDLKDGDVE